MISKIYTPSKELSPFIQSFRIIQTHHDLVNRVLPNSNFAIVFTLKGQISYLDNKNVIHLPSVIISGLRKSVRNINYQKNSKSIIVLFTEMGISSFLKDPLYELFQQSVSLDHFINKDKIHRVEENLNSAKSDLESIKMIEDFLLSILYRKHTDLLIQKSISEICAAKGNIKIRELSQKLFISIDAFEKRFRKTVGSTPKQFSSLIRLKSITQTEKPESIIDLALENGFYDQAHFNKEFKIFTGLTPTEFYTSENIW
ncbi:helix-turn-helix domain-containing protein [Tenacibaculum sp.]|uniref:helix-turn-helix domain-containing protein n=1 Tax=Tenacibaculum sp. TaxID=1906242 RepID=UPI003D0A3226